MSHNQDNKEAVIPVDLIRETVMAPYEYQKPQNGFGSTGVGQSQNLDQAPKKPIPEVEVKQKSRKSS